MTQKLQKLKTNMLVISDLAQNQHKQTLLLKKIDAKFMELENELKKLKTFDSSYFRSKSHFEEDGTQN